MVEDPPGPFGQDGLVLCAPVTFAVYDGDSLMGLLVLYVGDGRNIADSAAFEQAMRQLRDRAPLDNWRRGAIQLMGREIRPLDDITIEISQWKYWKKVAPVLLDRNRRKSADALLTENEFIQVRSLVGKLSWPAAGVDSGVEFRHLRVSTMDDHEEVIRMRRAREALAHGRCRREEGASDLEGRDNFEVLADPH